MSDPTRPALSSVSGGVRTLILPVLLALVIFVVVPLVLSSFGRGYFWQIANIALIFILLAASLHVVTGVAGLLHLGHAAFYGVGAYTAGLLASEQGMPFIVTVPAAAVVTASIAFLVALPTMRLVSIYFAVATLAIGQMIYLVLLNWVSFTHGPNGVILFSGLNLFGLDLSSPVATYLVVAVIVSFSILLIHRISHSYYGNALRSLREDDQCADAMGVRTVRLKMEAFVISAAFAGIAGALWAHTTGYISPGDFDFAESILILAMVVVGGLGSLPGAVIGALLLILLPEVLREVGDVRNIMVGIVMFLSILLLPKGLFGEVSALSMIRRQFGDAWRRDESGKGVGWR
ncbi:branched-chain amino acid ABC transporter permease [Acuticoccus kandeliae]|uniref:branched-chain amino acid ABC transporter permease n=1 Tax=Acuticoccus kandeliae TaxID=2073160 RepID=UPI001FEB03AD|nr:branched-chain amino acid ABC transporter permease [Acuticoccus kandeliae]